MKKVTRFEVQSRSDEQKLRVAAYARVSTDNDEQLTSLEVQKDYYEHYIKSNPEWEFAGLYYDEGISGTHKETRAGLLNLLEDCRNGKINYVIVKSISRLARNTVDALEIVRELAQLKVYIFFEKENIDTKSMNGELLLAILSGMAQNESVSISRNEKWGIQKRFRDGTYIISSPTYGYKNESGRMVIDPEKAEIIRFIFTEYLSGNGPQWIADRLNERGLVTRRQKKWSSSGILDILHNEAYIGKAVFQKTYTDDNFVKHTNDQDLPMYICENHHEPIITPEAFYQAQALMEHNGRTCGNVKGACDYQKRHPFSGKLICGECGGSFKRRSHYIKSGRYVTFCCVTHLFHKEKCGMLDIDEERLEAAYTNMLNKLIYYSEQVLKPLLSFLRNVSYRANQDRVDEIDRSLLQIADERRKLLELFKKGYLETVTYREKNAKLELERDTLQAEKNALMRSLEAGIDSVTEVEDLYRYCISSKPMTEFQKETVERFLMKVRVDTREEVTFELKCGLCLKERLY